MKLLIITQKVDKNDPILGFFHRWIEEFAKHCESLVVVCLEEGAHNLPENVRVLSLGKEGGKSRLKYIFRFYKYIWQERKNYDKVFVHMNQIYVILGALFWRLFKKKIGLWYTHGSVSPGLFFANIFTNKIFTASKESFRLTSVKIVITGHGIDIGFFFAEPGIVREKYWLSVGRLMQSKNHDVAIKEACASKVPLHIAGNGPERTRLESFVQELGTEVHFLGPLSQLELRNEYRLAAKLIHRSKTGSLDKVTLEAAACGCPVDSSDPAINSLPLSVEYVRKYHSLESLVPRILYNLKEQ